MNMKKLIALMLTLMMVLMAATACGGSGGEQTDENATETETEIMDSDAILKVVFDDLGIQISQASEIKVSVPDDDGHITVTFKVMDKDCSYVVDAYSGEIISKEVPDGIAEEANSSGDPIEKAINAAFESLDGYQGGAEDIHATQSGTDIIVEFDWNGQHYKMTYDTNEGRIVE